MVLAPELAESVFNTGLLGLGYSYYFGPFASLASGVDIRGSAGLVDRGLESFYGMRVRWGS